MADRRENDGFAIDRGSVAILDVGSQSRIRPGACCRQRPAIRIRRCTFNDCTGPDHSNSQHHLSPRYVKNTDYLSRASRYYVPPHNGPSDHRTDRTDDFQGYFLYLWYNGRNRSRNHAGNYSADPSGYRPADHANGFAGHHSHPSNDYCSADQTCDYH